MPVNIPGKRTSAMDEVSLINESTRDAMVSSFGHPEGMKLIRCIFVMIHEIRL